MESVWLPARLSLTHLQPCFPACSCTAGPLKQAQSWGCNWHALLMWMGGGHEGHDSPE